MNNRRLVSTPATCCCNITHEFMHAAQKKWPFLNEQGTKNVLDRLMESLHVLSNVLLLYSRCTRLLRRWTVIMSFTASLLLHSNSQIVKNGVTGLLQI